MKADEEDNLVEAMARTIDSYAFVVPHGAGPYLTEYKKSFQRAARRDARRALSAIRAAGYCVMPEEPSDDVANACDCIEAHLQTAHEGFAVIIEEEFRSQLQTVVRAARERVERIGAEEK